SVVRSFLLADGRPAIVYKNSDVYSMTVAADTTGTVWPGVCTSAPTWQPTQEPTYQPTVSPTREPSTYPLVHLEGDCPIVVEPEYCETFAHGYPCGEHTLNMKNYFSFGGDPCGSDSLTVNLTSITVLYDRTCL